MDGIQTCEKDKVKLDVYPRSSVHQWASRGHGAFLLRASYAGSSFACATNTIIGPTPCTPSQLKTHFQVVAIPNIGATNTSATMFSSGMLL
jgi:hypothetical protein